MRTKFFAFVAMCLLAVNAAFGQSQTVTGQVISGSDDEPLMGVAILVKGTSNGTATDLNGNFTLQNVPANATLVISYMGFNTQEVKATPKMNIVLQEDTELLNEVVVIGYGVQKKSDLTGAVGSVNETALKALSTTDAAAALQGKVAGVNIITDGAPGAAAEIRIRGISSNGGNISPLYIVDGLQVNGIQYLDPSMIESMEILKDGASAAIYGAEAGNGVVLITTKQGQTGKTSVSYTGKFTNQNFRKRPLMNRDELIEYVGLEYISDPQYMSSRIQDYDFDHPLYDNGVIDTDWIGAYLEPTWSQQHSLTLSGGNNQGHFFTSLNFVNNNGAVKGDRDVYKRFTAQVNADYQLFKWLQVGTTNSIEKYETKSVSQRGYSSSFESVINLEPLTPTNFTDPSQMPNDFKTAYEAYMNGTSNKRVFFDEDGYPLAAPMYSDVEGNPLAKILASDGTNEGFNINGTFFANLTPVKGLTITSRFGYRISQNTSHNFTAPYYIGRGSQDNYSISANANTGYYYQWENFANYNVTFAQKHDLTAMIGMSYKENNNDNISTSATGSNGAEILSATDPQFRYMSYVKADVAKDVRNVPGQSASLAYFGRLIYSYDNRYSVQANFRADAFDSSKLPAKNRWGYFPSFSAGWTISNESFVKDNIDTEVLSFLKLRGSWGRNGNVNVLNGYRYATTISVGDNWYQYGVANQGSTFASHPNYVNGLPNPDLTWETSDQVDAGLDARFLNNRLTFSADFFDKRTKDLLFDIDIPTELGASKTTVNGGTVLNRGWEFELGWRDRVGAFNYSVNANFTTLHNEVLSTADRVARQTNAAASSTNYKIQNAFEAGHSVWYLLGYEYEGVAENGDAIIKDINGDGQISAADLTDIGTTIPTFTYGLNINLEYKGFDFTLNGYGQGGNKIIPVTHRTGVKNNFSYYLENSWTADNTGAELPAPDKVLAADSPFWSSTGNMFKGNYFRIQTLQLGYTIPSRITKKAAISNLRLYVSLDDFFTITKYPGLDPATASVNSTNAAGLDWGSYPTMQKVVLGINLTF